MKFKILIVVTVISLATGALAQKRLSKVRATMYSSSNISSLMLSFYYREKGITKTLEMREEKSGKTWFICPSIIWRAIGRAALLCDNFDPAAGRQTVDSFPNAKRSSIYPTVVVQVQAPYQKVGVGFAFQTKAGDTKIVMELTPEQAYVLSVVLATETGDIEQYTK